MTNILYPKIHSPFKRDMHHERRPLMRQDWARPEFNFLQNVEWKAYEKVDGTNIRVIFDGKTVKFGGRTENAQIPPHLLSYLTDKFTPMKNNFLEVSEEKPLILFGEGFGYKIQNGAKYFNGKKEVGFCLFDARIGKWWIEKDRLIVFSTTCEIDIAPVITITSLNKLISLAERGVKSNFGDFYAEGMVATPLIELKDRSGARIITKIKHVDFFRGD